MALLGAIMFQNSAMDVLPNILEPAHFSEPLHQRIFARMRIMHRRSQLIEPTALAAAFSSEVSFQELGGIAYLAELFDRAPPGANAPDYARVVIEVGTRRALIRLGLDMAQRAADSTEEPNELLGEMAREAAHLLGAQDGIVLMGADEALDRVMDQMDNPGNHPAGINTGLAALDDHLGPWLPGDLIVLGGRPGMGKSGIAAVIDQNVALAGGGVIEIHAEMSVEQAWRRRLTATAYGLYAAQAPAYSAIRRRIVSFDQRQMLDKARALLRGMPLEAVKRTGITLSRLRGLVQRQAAVWERKNIPLGLITIDHVGLIRSDREHSSRVDQQTEISNGLKEMAGDFGVPILALAQLNRQVESREDKRPTLPDLRDSGSWEQDADIVIGAFRPAYYAKMEKAPADTGGKSTVAWVEWDQRVRSPWIDAILLKVREGDTGTVKLWAHMPTNTILGAAPDNEGGLF